VTWKGLPENCLFWNLSSRGRAEAVAAMKAMPTAMVLMSCMVAAWWLMGVLVYALADGWMQRCVVLKIVSMAADGKVFKKW
jgi:hypothetical protein